MGDTRTYEDFAGMLGRRVARVKEACGGAVARHQPGGAVDDKGYGVDWWNKQILTPKPEDIEKFYSYLPDYVDYVNEQHNAGKNSSDFGTRYGEFYDRMKAYENGGNERLRGRQRRARKKEGEWLGSEAKALRDSVKSNPDLMYDVIGEQAKRGSYHVSPSDFESLGNGGNIGNVMRYTVYFKDGGLLPRSQRRVYQTGGKASAQDTMQQLYQLTQVAMNGSGQEQQQAMQALGQFVGEAMNGNQQYAQIIQAVFDGAKKGSREMTQMAQVFQSIMQQMQKREFGGRLDYITMLRNGGRPRYQEGGEVRTYGEEIRDRLGKIGPIVRNLGRRLGFGKGAGKGAGKGVGNAADEATETEPYDNPYKEPVQPPVYEEPVEVITPKLPREDLPYIGSYRAKILKDPYWYGDFGDYYEYEHGYDDLDTYLKNLRRSKYPNWLKDLENSGSLVMPK